MSTHNLVYTRNFAKVIKTLCARLADCYHTRYVWYIYAQGIKWKIVEDTWPGIYTRVSTIAFRRNADGISSFRSRRVAWRERKQLREDARRRKLAVLLASRRGADRWREGRKKFSACSSLGEEVDRGGWMEKEEGISRRKFWKRHSCGRCSSFSNGGNLCGNLKFEGVACRKMFWDCCLLIYLVGERLVGWNHFEMMNEMGRERELFVITFWFALNKYDENFVNVDCSGRRFNRLSWSRFLVRV